MEIPINVIDPISQHVNASGNNCGEVLWRQKAESRQPHVSKPRNLKADVDWTNYTKAVSTGPPPAASSGCSLPAARCCHV